MDVATFRGSDEGENLYPLVTKKNLDSLQQQSKRQWNKVNNHVLMLTDCRINHPRLYETTILMIQLKAPLFLYTELLAWVQNLCEMKENRDKYTSDPTKVTYFFILSIIKKLSFIQFILYNHIEDC